MNNDSGSKNNARRKEFSNEMRQNIGNKLMDRFTELKSRLNASDRNSLSNCYQTSMQYEGKGFHSMTSKQNQKFVQQRNASEQKQQPLCLQKPSNSLQQPLLLKDNVFVMPQPVTLGVSNSNVLNFQQQHGTPKKSFLPTEAIQKEFQHFPSLYQYQCLLDQQELRNSKRALLEASPLIEQSEISHSHLYKRQKQIVSEPPQYQHFQPVAMKNSPGNQSSEQHFNNTTFIQQNQKFVQQRNASEQKQQPLCLQKNSNSPQQPLVLKENVLVMPQEVNFSKFNALNFQQQQNCGPAKKCFLPTEVMQEGFQRFCSPHQAKGLADHKKIRNSERAHPEASTAREASASNETLDVADWHHQSYRELESLRTKCLPTLKLLFQKFEKNRLESKSELPDTHKREMSQLARMINFLNASPNDIALISNDVFDSHKLTIIHTDNSIRNSIATQQRAQLQSSQPQISSHQQRGNGNVEFQSVNLASRSTLDGPSPRPIEHPETLTQGVQIEKELMEMQNTIEGENPQMLQQQQLTAQHEEHPFEHKPSVASQLSSLSCRPQSAETSTQVDAQTELQSLTSQPIDHQCVVVSNKNPSVVSQLSSATCPQSAVSSTLIDAQTELQSLIAEQTDHQCAVVTNLNPSVVSRLSTATCTHSAVSSTEVDAQTEPLSLAAQPIDHQFAVVSNLNSTEASGLSSATCPQSVMSSTLVDGQTEHQSPRVQPIDRLCAAVQSVSPGALLSSVEDIFSVVSSADFICRTTIDNNLKAASREDLAFAQYRHTSAKHDITPHAFDALIPSIDETEPIGASGTKRQKPEDKYHLLDEIKRINHRLIEMVVDMESSEVDLNNEVVKEKVVQCSYIPMAIRKAYKSNISSDVFPELKLRVLVPDDYPNASPIVLDSLIAESTSDKSKNFMEKSKLKLGIFVCMLSKPFSLEDIARAWDQCCRTVFCDFAHTLEGGSFSSRFGSWEVCSI